ALKLVFCGHLEPAARVALLERRRAELTNHLARSRRSSSSRGDRYSRSLFEHRTQSTQRDLEWIEALLAAALRGDGGHERRERGPREATKGGGVECVPRSPVSETARAAGCRASSTTGMPPPPMTF